MSFSTLRLDIDAGLAELTLTRPEAANTVNLRFAQELEYVAGFVINIGDVDYVEPGGQRGENRQRDDGQRRQNALGSPAVFFEANDHLQFFCSRSCGRINESICTSLRLRMPPGQMMD